MQNTKTKRVFQLRKTGLVRPQPVEQTKALDIQQNVSTPVEQEKLSNRQFNKIATESIKRQSQPIQNENPLSSLPDIVIDQQQLHFYSKIRNVQVKNIKVKNIGSSAIYYQWSFKNLSKINANAVRDPKPTFYCHYQPNVIKPGHQEIFSFSFYCETPGVYVEEVELICQPEPAARILPIKLKGQAFIEDILKSKRQKFNKLIKERITEAFTRQVVHDIVNQVKPPVPPLPDVSNPEVAQREFEKANINQKLYYRQQVHNWFAGLYEDICNVKQIPVEERYWNQSVAHLNRLIQTVDDPILRQSFQKRLQNYKLLSVTRPPQKSDLYNKVRDLLLNTGYALGGTLADESKKQLEMWQIPFQQPSQTQTQEAKAAKKQQRAKVIAEWVKKMKKKKWTEEQEKQLLKNYRQKLQKRVSHELASKFDGFDDEASYESGRASIKQKFDSTKYFQFLQRLKTVKQYPIESKKILLKFDLKLKQNCGEALVKLQQYLHKKREEQLRAEEQLKNQQANKAKKKAPVVKKKKGQKQQQETKILTFDFNTILDQESWEGFIETLRFIIERQPALLIIGMSYGPKIGIYNEKYSVKFLLEILKQVEPSIQFLQHKGLFELKQKIQQETLNEGSIYFTENLSFLPCQGMQTGEVKHIEKQQNGQKKTVETISTHKLLMSQIDNQLQNIMPAIDIIVRQDRFVNRSNGICSYGKKVSILGLNWWKYIAFALRTQNSQALVGGKSSTKKLVLLSRMIRFCSRIYLAGEIGLKVWMAEKNVMEFGGIKLAENEKHFIEEFIHVLKSEELFSKISLPQDFILLQSKEGIETKITVSAAEKPQLQGDERVIDIGNQTWHQIQQINVGHLFIVDYPAIITSQLGSLQAISRALLSKKETKKVRHLQQQSSPAGINYDKDLVVYLIGIQQEIIDKIQLKERKIRNKQGQEDEQEQQQPQKEQNEIKKIDQICDFRISDKQSFESLLSAEFSYGLKDVSKYPKSN